MSLTIFLKTLSSWLLRLLLALSVYDSSWFSSERPGKAPDIVPASSRGRRSQRPLGSQRTGGPRNLSRSEHFVLLAKDQSYVSGPSWQYCTCSELMLRCCPGIQGQGTARVFLVCMCGGFIALLVLFSNSSHLVQFY